MGDRAEGFLPPGVQSVFSVKLFQISLFFLTVALLCSCASPCSENCPETGTQTPKLKKDLHSRNAVRKPVKEQSRSGVFCGDRDVCDDF